MNDESKAIIEFRKFDNTLSVKTKFDGRVDWHEANLSGEIHTSTLLFWVLCKVKDILFNMPVSDIECRPLPAGNDQLNSLIAKCASILNNTNALIKASAGKKDAARKNENVLIYNIDNGTRYVDLFNLLTRKYGNRFKYLEMASGFDKMNRVWRQNGIPMSIEDLLAYLEENKIQKIIAPNHYFLEKYLYLENINILSLFVYMGIEYIVVDNDIWDNVPGFLCKKFFSHESFTRFTFDPACHEYWDNAYKIPNVNYAAIPQDYENEVAMKCPDDDYDILILSNSRLALVKQFLKPILFLLDLIKRTNTSAFETVPLWYWAMRHMVTEIMQLTEFEKIHYNSALFNFFYAVTQFMKYEVIHSIQSDRGIKVFGDLGWGDVFPQYYQKKRLNHTEVKALFDNESDRYLYLMFNYAITYFDAAGATIDSISRNVPYINYPPIVRPKKLEGLRHLEYGSPEELNHLIDHFPEKFENREYHQAVRTMQAVFRESANDSQAKIVHGDKYNMRNSLYYQIHHEHMVLLEQKVISFIDTNESFLRHTFDAIFKGGTVQFTMENSSLFQRNYVQGIINSKTMK